MENVNINNEAKDGQSHLNGNADGFVNGNESMADPMYENPLLDGSDSAVTSNPTCEIRCWGPAKHRLITVEPAMIFFVIAFGTMLNLKGMYIRQQIALKYGEESDPGQSSLSCGLNMTDENDTDSKIPGGTHIWK